MSLLVGYFSKKKKCSKEILKSNNDFIDSSFDNSSINNVKGDNVNFNHTIVNNLKDKIIEKDKSIPVISTPEITKAKQDFIHKKSKLQTNVYAMLAAAKAQNFESRIEIRHVCDEVEELINANHLETADELKEMKEEGLIEFVFKKDEFLLSPYTRIITTRKFYTIIDAP